MEDRCQDWSDIAQHEREELTFNEPESEASRQLSFDEKYSIDRIFNPDQNGRPKIVVSVVDSGSGISLNQRLNLFKLLGGHSLS